MPKQQLAAQVVVVGGGVIGLCSALSLAEAGARVTLLERGEPGREASWAGGGILSPLYPWRGPERVWQLAAESLALYPQLCSTLGQHTGIDPQWVPSGLLLLDAGEIETAARWCRQQGLAALEVIPQQAEPALGSHASALALPWVAQLRNPRLCRALLLRLQQLGVRVLTGLGHVEVESDAGRARLRAGSAVFEGDAIVIAAGAWSAQMLAATGWNLPIAPVAGQMLLLGGAAGVLRHIVLSDGRYLIPRLDGQILVGSTVEEQGFSPHTTAGARAELLAVAVALMPDAAKLPVLAHWVGLRPGSPDGVPFIGRHPELGNLYVNAGHYRNGITLAPASAARLTRLICSA